MVEILDKTAAAAAAVPSDDLFRSHIRLELYESMHWTRVNIFFPSIEITMNKGQTS